MNAPVFNFDLRVAQYRALRQKEKEIKERHKAELAPYADAKEKLEALFLAELIRNGQESAKTESGTVYKTVKNSASLDDPDTFLDFVLTSGRYELLDRKANVTAVAEYMQENGVVVPGVKFASSVEVGVRAPTKKG